MSDQNYSKRGYLHESHHVFYLKEPPQGPVAVHYHDFHKIMLLLDGEMRYSIEGTEYALMPGDVVLVSAGEIHCPVYTQMSVYERVIIYVSQDLAESEGLAEGYAGLMNCFPQSGDALRAHVLRPSGERKSKIAQISAELAYLSGQESDYADFCRRLKVLELLAVLGRITEDPDLPEEKAEGEETSDPVTGQILSYISDHIREESLCIDNIAEHFGMSRSGLMHMFRRNMGCTVGGYISEKRLFLAKTAIAAGMPVTEACYACGFGSYGAFYHAYRRRYGQPPGAKRAPLPGVPVE